MSRRPVIAPGLPVLTAPAGVLQVGLSAEHRLRVPDSPAVRRALELLARGETLPPERDFQRARSLLGPVLRDGDALIRPGIGAGDAASVALRHPASAAERLAARSRARIRVVGDLGVDPGGLLDAVGLRSHPDEPEPASAVLVLSRGEPARDDSDALVRDGTPHLVVRAVESDLVIGPFVVPGRTACLRCCDLHRDDREPGYGALLRDALLARRRDGVPEPVDTALVWVALGWAVRDLLRHAEGERPSTWSTTVSLDAPTGPGDVRRWAPHPDCSCTWAYRTGDQDRSATMEA